MREGDKESRTTLGQLIEYVIKIKVTKVESCPLIDSQFERMYCPGSKQRCRRSVFSTRSQKSVQVLILMHQLCWKRGWHGRATAEIAAPCGVVKGRSLRIPYCSNE